MVQQSLSLPKVYRLRPVWRIILLAITLVCVVFLSTSARGVVANTVTSSVTLAFIICIPIIPFLIALQFGQLTLKAQGILWQSGFGYRMFTPWYNLAGMGIMTHNRNRNATPGFFLLSAAQRGVPLRHGIAQGVAVIDLGPWSFVGFLFKQAPNNFFPLPTPLVGNALKNGEIKAYLREYAPQLFQETGSYL